MKFLLLKTAARFLGFGFRSVGFGGGGWCCRVDLKVIKGFPGRNAPPLTEKCKTKIMHQTQNKD